MKISVFTLALGIASFTASALAGIIPPERVVDWRGNVGVVGDIPQRTQVFVNVLTTTNTSFRCKGDGTNDDLAPLMAAIGNCPEDQVVYLPPGRYRISDRIALSWKRRFVLRGAGPTQTSIEAPGEHFFFGGSQWPSPTVHATLAQDAPKGATSLVVTDPSSFGAGQMWAVDCLNDTNFIMTQNACYDLDRNCTRSIINMIYVTNVVGNTIYFQRPLVWNFTTRLASRLSLMTDVNNVPKAFITERIGIESLRLSHGGQIADGQPHIDFSHAKDCWVYDVDFDEINRYAIMFDQSMDCTVRKCTLGPAQTVAVPNRGYGIWSWRSSYILAEDNISYHMTAPFMFPTSVGCVVAYNFSTNCYAGGTSETSQWMGYDFTMGHGPQSMFNLVEGNIGSSFAPDNYYGSSSHLTAFRNYFRGFDRNVVRNEKTIDIQAWSLTNNIVGNILGAPEVPWNTYDATNSSVDIIGGRTKTIYRLGFANMGNDSFDNWDPRPMQSLFRHGNYDQFNKVVQWTPAVDQQLPASLYLPGKPTWWGSSTWPPIGPDLQPMISTIPAQTRFGALASSAVQVKPPTNLRPSSAH